MYIMQGRMSSLKGKGVRAWRLVAIYELWSHCVPDVVLGQWKYMGSDMCHLIGLDSDTHKPKCSVNNSEKNPFLNKIDFKGLKQL